MITIPEIYDSLNQINLEKRKLEDELSRRMKAIIVEEIRMINLEFGASPKSINVEFVNVSAIRQHSDHYMLQEVIVKI